MVRRPKEWENWTSEKRMKWLRKHRIEYNGGRKVLLSKKDAPRIWSLLKQHENLSLVADLVGVERTTIWRFLKKHPMPKDFVVQEDMQLIDFPEMQVYLKRLEGFTNKATRNTYLQWIRKFFEFQKKYHPQRAKPSLWTSDDINEFIYGNEDTGYDALPSNLWHVAIVPLRSLALKAQEEFPKIQLGLLPTKKTHKAKRSLAGHEEYYYTPQEVDRMIEYAPTTQAQGLLAFLYNLGPRTLATTKARVENLSLVKHEMLIQDKGSIWWDTYGMTNRTAKLLENCLQERNKPKSGWLFVNNNGDGKETQMSPKDVNGIIKEAGHRAGITNKVLSAKAFRKSLVSNFMNIKDANPLVLAGSGKERKTCFCVGWTLDVLMKHYAPKMKAQIETYRQKFGF